MASRQGRQERPIDPEGGPLAAFASALRALREECGSPTYRELATCSKRTGTKSYSDTTFSNAARGDSQPSREVTRAFVLSCHWYAKSDRARAEAAAAEWDARWQELEAALAPAAEQPPADTSQDQTAAPAVHGLDDPPRTLPHAHPRRRWIPASRKGRLLLGAAALVVAAGVLAPIIKSIVAPGSAAADVLPAPEGTASIRTETPGNGPGTPQPAVPSEPPGLEKGTLGEDSRCSAPIQGPETVTWRVCARVEAEWVSFALKITNRGSRPIALKTRLQYARENTFHPCPGDSGPRQSTVPSGQTIVTDTKQCAVAREERPWAYQGVGWVVPADATDGTYKLAPTAHVYPDRVIWQPDLL
ncbi:helix-turn-helix domain-containing protein [Streptomyces sp. NRRL S-350]|uniref:helix-turn-helix domain-containing protein n=1 Tax=Streptomyces sp. NRRL S-350 TaxID=1463902 RepID=UPI0004C2015B|nr:helix-turn-helix domain-containing protein [Streptomyces sp. NRRL S-350]